jgi:16S rRNA (adenine1518-N6/adenine1519-N6)-dimethyltransferase
VSGERVVAGNLPYQITGKLLEMTVPVASEIARAVFMVQKEVADRLAAAPASEAYGQLSVFVQASFAVERALIVRAGCFHPAPRVDSAVVVLRPLEKPRAVETDAFRAVVHAAFGARRKTLRNAIAGLMQDDAKKQNVAATGIDLGRRGETLSVEEFAALAKAIA